VASEITNDEMISIIFLMADRKSMADNVDRSRSI
jgi:hypothetical protein